jgi:hypothetical protein
MFKQTSRFYLLVCVGIAGLLAARASAESGDGQGGKRMVTNDFAQESPTGYQAEGQIRYDVVLPLGGERHWTRDFKVTVEGCKWLVESFSKTENQYSLQMCTDKSILGATRMNQSNNPALNDYAAIVEENDVPNSDLSGISEIWLAYASGCYLQSVTNNHYKPVWLLDDPSLRKEDYAVPGILDLLSGNLPRQLVYLNDGVIYARAPDGNRAILRAPANFKGVVTNATYRVLATTNIDSLLLPASFEFQRFGVRPDFTTYPLAKVTGTLKSLKTGVRFDEQVPDLHGTVFFKDGECSYRSTNFYGIVENYAYVRKLQITH